MPMNLMYASGKCVDLLIPVHWAGPCESKEMHVFVTINAKAAPLMAIELSVQMHNNICVERN